MSDPIHWQVHITCLTCAAEFDVDADPSRDVVLAKSGQRKRLLLLWVPNECPKCHNLRVVVTPPVRP